VHSIEWSDWLVRPCLTLHVDEAGDKMKLFTLPVDDANS